MKHEDFHKQMEPEAKKRITYRYLIEAIADEEKIEISDKEADKEAEKMAETYGVTKEEMLSQFGGLDVVKYDMRMRKALEIISEN
jgi:trigger factor